MPEQIRSLEREKRLKQVKVRKLREELQLREAERDRMKAEEQM